MNYPEIKDRALETLRAMVAIPSVNPFRYFPRTEGAGYYGLGSEEQMNLFVEERLREAGFAVSRQELHPRKTVVVNGSEITVPARWNVLAVSYPAVEWNGKSILFLGHTDTVDVKSGWTSDPFIVDERIVDGRQRWYGLGANDMKGGLAAILEAVREARAYRYAIKIAFVVDEEFYSFGAEALCESDFLDDVVLAIAPEIGDPSQAGNSDSVSEQRVGIGRTGRVEYDIRITGAACHGVDAFISTDAINAVHESAKLQVEFIRYCQARKRVFRAHGTECLNSAYISHHSGGAPILSVPFQAAFVLDRILLPDESPDDEIASIREFVRNCQRSGTIDPRAEVSVAARPRPTTPCKPYICPLDVAEVDAVLRTIKESGNEISYFIGRSVADENRTAARGIPTLTIGPAGAGSHTSEEWVDPASILKLTDVFRRIISQS